MKRGLPDIAAIAILAATGIANGLWNDRWRPSRELEDMIQRLPEIPLTIGDWVGKDDSDPELTTRLKYKGSIHELVSRVYVNSRTGAAVSLVMATGKPGPIATHNPLTCINGSRGLELHKEPARARIPAAGKRHTFSHADFVHKEPDQPGQRVYWSWHHKSRGWIDSEDPRTTFADHRALTKIYLARLTPPKDAQINEDPAQDPIVQFIQDCLPTIDSLLYPQAEHNPES